MSSSFNNNRSSLIKKHINSNILVSITLFVLVIIYMAITVYYPYNAIDDEVYQFEAAQNMFKGLSYTTASLGNDLSAPPRDWLKSWPMGYSFALKLLSVTNNRLRCPLASRGPKVTPSILKISRPTVLFTSNNNFLVIGLLAGCSFNEEMKEISSAWLASARYILMSVGILPVEYALSITMNLSRPMFRNPSK